MSLLPLVLADSWSRPSRLLGQHFGMEVDDDDIIASPFSSLVRSFPSSEIASRFMNGSSVASIKSDDDGFQVNVDVQQFSPDEITVKIDEEKNLITVEGKHEEKQDEHGFISRHFIRRYVLPDDHDVKQLQSNLSSDGVLTITAPKIDKEDRDSRVIPIQQTGRPFRSKKFKAKLRLGGNKGGRQQQNTPAKRNSRYK